MSQSTTLQYQIMSKLNQNLDLHYLDVVNESYMHNVPAGSESHFKLIAVSNEFEGMRLLARHRTINQILADELANHIHALAMHTYTITEWNDIQGAPDSPMCMGGKHK